MSELNEFFEQILHTERSLSSRNVKLRKLKEEIQACVQALQKVCEEVETRQGELAVRNVKMVDQEVEARLLDMRHTILEDQCSKLTAANQILTSELEASKMKLESDSEQFLEELKEFGRSYDLIGSGYKHREQMIQKRVCTLQDELMLLEAELIEFESEREEVKKLERKLSEAEKTLSLKKEEKRVLEKEVLEYEAEIRQLKEEHESCNSKLSSDPEIIKLQEELEKCKNCPEEKTYHSLHRELEELQRLCYHKQMKQHVPQRKNKGFESGRHNDNSTGLGASNRDKPRLSNNAPLWKSGHYNPYTQKYMPTIEAKNDGGCRTESRDDGGSQGGYEISSDAGVGAGGQDEVKEGWDDDLAAAELASYDLGVDEMEWMEEEGETPESGECDSKEAKERDTFSGRDETIHSRAKQKQHTNIHVPVARETVKTVRKSSSFIGPVPHVQLTSKPVVRQCGGRPANSAHLAHTTDSPMPGTTAARKPSGQSIYKTPGHDPVQAGVPKTAKRVRFRY